MKVQLLTFAGCPNAELARVRLHQVLGELGLPVVVEEIDVSSPTTPQTMRGWSSPTVLIDGEDLEGLTAGDCASCRLYPGGAPSVRVLRERLQRRRQPRSSRGALGGLPAMAATLFPAITCPACLGPFASVLTTLGIGFVAFTKMFLAVYVTALSLGIASVAYATRRHRSPWPLTLTLLGTLAAGAGRFVLQEPVVERLGLPLLMAGAIWSAWLTRRRTEAHA